MSRIAAIDPNHAPDATRGGFAAVQKMLGAIPNVFRVAAQSPAALDALVALFDTTARGAFRPAVREAIALAVAESNGCDYCLSAHAALGKRSGLTDGALAAARAGTAADAHTTALLQLAQTVVRERGRLGDDALELARSRGVTDAEVVEVIAHVALNVFTNYLNIVADTDIDFPVVRAGEGLGKAA